MKRSKIILTVCIVIITFMVSNPAKAQDNTKQQQMAELIKTSTPEQRTNLQTKMMTSKLNLDTVTSQKVYAINLKANQKLDPLLKGDASGGRFAKLRQMKSIEDDKDKELKKVLNPDQYKQYEAMKEEMKEKMKEKMQEKKAAQAQ
ncbi:hypothetical protein [uncultured Mucilaginibacter sp.]|uniref:hypothetical protein n=1 Tax=uncultured Mucilaginibacter sp. TaxID=797541 RepID=UPI0026004868|nr:hypothetical protein [uncultured Mucilaginibacter sp.]